MTKWKADKGWSDRFIPEIKRILGEHLIGIASDEDDQTMNTDLITLTMPDRGRIGCRVRRFAALGRFGGEFTIRASRPSGTKTELQKIYDGWGDYFFYGFSNQEETSLAQWVLCDLDVMRSRHIEDWDFSEQKNPDGSAGFYAFKLTDMPDDFIVAKSSSFAKNRYGAPPDDRLVAKRMESNPCPKCGSSHYVDVNAGNGKIRRDCDECGFFKDWTKMVDQNSEQERQNMIDSTNIPTKVRRAVMSARGCNPGERTGRCQDCETVAPLELHHLTYYRDAAKMYPIDGHETVDDLAAVCRYCHLSKHVDVNGEFWRDPQEKDSHWQSYHDVMDKD